MKRPFRLRQVVRQMWFLPAVFCLIAIGVVAAAHYGAYLLPKELPFDVSEQAIENILTIVATSMLAVTTFALATMVTALSSASQMTTPRAVRLIAEDRAAQAPISIFIGAFLFSVVGIVALSSGFYSASGRLILFAATILVLVILIGALIRWINKITSIGQVGETIARVETATTAALHEMARRPLGGCTEAPAPPPDAVPVHSASVRYVQQIRPEALQRVAEAHDLRIHVAARAGTYATPARPLARVTGHADEAARAKIRGAFVLSRDRTFDHDPRFGLIVLNEIADRALSPGVNDPGTAINVLHTQVRILLEWISVSTGKMPEPEWDRVFMAPIAPSDILVDAFRPIARDGADNVEVCLKLLRSLEAVRAAAPDLFGTEIDAFAAGMMERVRAKMAHPADLAEVERTAAPLLARRAAADGGRG